MLERINNWSLFNIFISYLKRNKVIIFSMFFLPIIFVGSLAGNYKITFDSPTSDGLMILMILWIIQSAGFAIQTFLAILLDFKQSVIYRRIGLTRIKPTKFILIASCFNFMLTLISNLFIFIIISVLAFSLHWTNTIATIFNWHLLIIILFTLSCMFLMNAIVWIMATLIKTRTGQTIVGIIINLLIIAPLYVLAFLLNTLNANSSQFINIIGLAGYLGIFIGGFVIINLLSALFYYLAIKWFKWFE